MNSCSSGAMRGPGPRSYVPSIGIHPLMRFSASNMRLRSTIRSRSTRNFDIGSSVIGRSSLSTSAVQPMRALPFTSMAHEPQTSSRQLASQAGAGTRSPSIVTGFLRTSMSAEMTLCCGAHGKRNVCQYDRASGPSWRRTRSSIVRSGTLRLRRDVVLPRTRRDERDVDRIVAELRTVGRPAGLGGLEPVLVVALGELGFVVRAAAFVAAERAERDDARQLEHVPQLLHEGDLVVRPAPAVGEADSSPAILQHTERVVGVGELLVVADD